MAAERLLPQSHFYSVEYPGYVRSSSVPAVIHNLGGQARIDNVFRRTTPKAEVLLELSLRPDSLFSHPVPGDVVGTNNLVLKLTKRRKKCSSAQNEIPGEYNAEVVGVMSRTIRFRSIYSLLFILSTTQSQSFSGMADFQYEPDRADPIYGLRQSMHHMNG
jgi:general transcription factor 3C polypeptide 5 (transcription factor C subunit 1)